MKHTSLLIAAVVFTSSPALASGKCSTAPQSKWQPQPKLEAQLLSDGFKVRQIKVERGCYEVYATDKDGKRINMAFNAETLEKLDNAEAGED
jgi:hypothetical protein